MKNWFPETQYAWHRMKLLLAELLVLSTVKGDHSLGYRERAGEACDAISQFRELYYPEDFEEANRAT